MARAPVDSEGMAQSNVRDVFQAEIRTRDLKRAMAFYAAVFDWKIFRSAHDYALIDSGAMPVIGIMETRNPKFPLGVVNNVLVEDCEKEGARAVELGGSICVRKWVIPNSGAYVGTQDPWGNELFFWEPYTEGRPHLKGSGTNPIVLAEIATADLPAAIAYYKGLVGWSFWSVVFGDQGALAEGCGLKRGVSLVTPQAGRGTLDYAAVADLAETGAKVREAGGRVVVEARDLPGEGRFIVLEDLDGNRMGALQRLAP
jgi:predicted enzyme related to lactoylglutathione lyase